MVRPRPAKVTRLRAVPSPRERTSAPRAPLGALIGRDETLVQLRDTLTRDEPLVTVLGPPGIGKTRVALRFFELERDRFTGGAWLCDLIEVRSQAGLVHAVASAVGVDEATVDGLADALSARGSALLVLDNFEQLTKTCALAVRAWCQAAPELRVLVTSRERLGVPGERVVELPPLACPAADAAADDIANSDAVRLFSARAIAIGGDASDPKAIAALVRKLEGIPLAIELAAARTRVLTPKELATRLEARFALLEQLPRETDGRQRTLESAIDWSWNMLTAEEQLALAECSVFAGGFTASSAEAVLSGERVVDLVGALRDKSLIHAVGPGRFALYVSIREYALRKLASLPGHERALRDRHARRYAMAAKPFNEARTFHGVAPDGDLRTELTQERENIVAALLHASAHMDDVEVRGELANAVALLQATPVESCHASLESAIALIPAKNEHFLSLRIRLLLARQSLLNSMGRFAESRADLVAVLDTPNLPPGMRALGLVMQGIQLRYQSLYQRAWDSHVAAESVLAPLELPRMQAMNYACMGRLQCDLGNPKLSRAHNERARSICVDIGDRWLEGLVLANLGQLEQELGNFDAADELLSGALERFRESSEQQYFAIYSSAHGDLQHERGDVDAARKSYARAAAFLDGWRTHRYTVSATASWASLEAAHGHASDAQLHLARARRGMERASTATVRVAFEAHAAIVALARASAARNDEALAHERRRWSEWLSAVRAGEGEDAWVARESFDVRFALRMLSRALAGEPNAALSLEVGPECAWFSVRGQARVDLRRRGSLRRILEALVEQHGAAAGRSLDQRQLLARGWPNERLLADAASKRLRVAVATLRKLGLRELLITRDDGYTLDPRTSLKLGGSF